MSDEQTREVLDMYLASVRELENMTDRHEQQTAEELHARADELTEEMHEYPERFTDQDCQDYWREIEELRAAAHWICAEIPDHDGSTSYVECYLCDALEITVRGRFNEDERRWEPDLVEVLVGFGGPNVWITGPHGTGDEYVDVVVGWRGTQRARTLAPNLAEHLAGLVDNYMHVGASR